MPDSAGDAVKFAQLLLDPTSQGLFKEAFLLPYCSAALRSVRNEITSRAVTAPEALTVLPAVPAGTASLGGYTAPGGALALMEEPVTIREKPAGDGPEFYTAVRRVEELPPRVQVDRLLCYTWIGGSVGFLGATQALDIEVRYRAAWLPVTEAAQRLPAPGLVPTLGWWTAALVGEAMDQAQAAAGRLAEAKHLLSKWIAGRVLESQRERRRPRHFDDGGLGWWEGSDAFL